MIDFERGEQLRFVLRNRTMMPHPMHLHGHSFRPRAGRGAAGPLRDTVLLAPMEELDRMGRRQPGWLGFHCPNAYHQEAGMMRHLRVS